MGFKVLNVLVKGKKAEIVHTELSIFPTDEYDEVPDAPISGMELPNGDYLLGINYGIPNEELLAKLSRNASVVTCYVHEGVMISFASEWSNGIELWSVLHDPNEGISNHLATSGEPPSQLDIIRERLQTQQKKMNNADYIFDIPVELFVALGGIRYDKIVEGNPWQILESSTGQIPFLK
jgi:hypothetical protein